ncbi:hypothetical protein PG995_001567 [Apiospora arundinis]|uniref:Uncharacterized protein n=1 Tax=Apiospora arundinis TaxID=335852 RepID=A0ABR2J8B3_9PEZI
MAELGKPSQATAQRVRAQGKSVLPFQARTGTHVGSWIRNVRNA